MEASGRAGILGKPFRICFLRQRYLESHSVHRARSPQAIWVHTLRHTALVKHMRCQSVFCRRSLTFFRQPWHRAVQDWITCLLL